MGNHWVTALAAGALLSGLAGCAGGLAGSGSGAGSTSACSRVTNDVRDQTITADSAAVRLKRSDLYGDERRSVFDEYLSAQIAALQMIVDNSRCFTDTDVSKARGMLPVVQAQLVDLRSS